MELEEAAHPTPRGTRLLAQIRSFDNLLQIIGPAARSESFEDEAQRLYARSVPSFEAGVAHQVIAALEAAVPGPGPLSHRMAVFYRDFIVPADRRRVVFERALRSVADGHAPIGNCREPRRSMLNGRTASRLRGIVTVEAGAARFRSTRMR